MTDLSMLTHPYYQHVFNRIKLFIYQRCVIAGGCSQKVIETNISESRGGREATIRLLVNLGHIVKTDNPQEPENPIFIWSEPCGN